MPVLKAEERLNKLFTPGVSEDQIYDMAMLVYEDRDYALRLVKIYADSKHN